MKRLTIILFAFFGLFWTEGCRSQGPAEPKDTSSESSEVATTSKQDETMNTNENVIYAQINGFGGTYTEKFALFCENPNGRVFLYAFNVETKTSSIYCFDPGCEHKPTERDLVTGEPLSTPCMAEELGGHLVSLREDCSYFFDYPNLIRADIEGKNQHIIGKLNLPIYSPAEELFTKDCYFMRYMLTNELIEQKDDNGESEWIYGDILEKRKVGIIRMDLADGKTQEIFADNDLYEMYINFMVEYDDHLYFLCSGIDVPYDTLPNGFEDWNAFNEAINQHSHMRLYDYDIKREELTVLFSEDHNFGCGVTRGYILKQSLEGSVWELYDTSERFICELPFAVGNVIKSDQMIIVETPMNVNNTVRCYHMYDPDERKIIRSVEIENLNLAVAVGDSYYCRTIGSNGKSSIYYISAEDFWNGNTDQGVIMTGDR